MFSVQALDPGRQSVLLCSANPRKPEGRDTPLNVFKCLGF